MPPNWENSSATFFNVSVFSRWCSFPLQKIVLHFSVPEPVPASRSAPCGSPGIVLILVNHPTKNSPPGRHGQEGCFQSISFTIPAAWRSVLEIQRSESENLLGFCHIPQILPSGTWRLLLRSPPLHPAPTERIRRF